MLNTGTASAIDITGTLTAKTATTITNQNATSGETVEGSGTLNFADTSSITGGQVTVDGTLNLQGTTASLNSGKLTNSSGQINVSGSNNSFASETVLNTGVASAIDVTGTLTVKSATTITNQNATSGETVEGSGTLNLADTSSITGGQVTVDGTLNLQGTTASLNSGKLTNSSGQINVSGSNNAFSAETVLNTGTASAIDITGALTVKSATTITNQNATSGETIEGSGTLNLADTSSITGGQVTVDGTLNLQGTTASLNSGKLTNSSGQVNVSGSNNSFAGETVLNTGAASAIDITGALTIKSATTITNQNATSGETIEGSGTLNLADTSSITGGQVTVDGTLNLQGTTASLNSGKLTNSSGQVNVSGSNNSFAGETVLNTGAASAIDITGALTAKTGTTITNQNATSGETIEGSGTLNFADTSSITGGQVTVDGTLNLQGTTASLTSGKLTNSSGQVNVSGSNNSFAGETVLNTGTASAIDITGALTVKSATTITNQNATSGETVESSGTLTLNDTSSITGGQLVNLGNVYVEASTGVLFDGVNVDNSGGTIHVDLNASSPAKLIIDDGTSISDGSVHIGNVGTLEVSGGGATLTGGVTITTDNGGIIQIDDGATLTLSGATINGGAVNDGSALGSGTPTAFGTIAVTASSEIENAGLNYGNVTVGNAILTLDNDTVTGTTFTGFGATSIIHVDGGDTLTLNNVNITGTSAVTIGAQGLVQTNGSGLTWSGTNVTNDGTIEVHSGSLEITGSIGGSGTVQIDAGALFVLNASDTQNITYAGGNGAAGELQIDTSTFGGTITGLSATDEIDLRTIGYGLNGLHTTGTYVSNSTNTGGVLTVTDGANSISMTLVGDYRDAHFAGATDHNGGTLITLNAADDLPVFGSNKDTQAGSVTEVSSQTGIGTLNPVTADSGSVTFTDIDLTERPTGTITAQTLTWTAFDGTHPTAPSPQLAEIEAALQLQQPGNTNNGTVGWTYSVPDDTLDFLATGETLQLVSTITLDDHEGGTDTATVTIDITGANDTPTIAATSNAFSEASTTPPPNPTGSTTPDIVSGTVSFTDADLSDHHTVSITAVSASGVTSGLTETNAVQLGWVTLGAVSDSTGGVTGSDTWTFSAPDDTFDYLAVGEQLTLTYTAQVSDGHGGVITTPFTVTVTGTNDTPTIAATSNAFSEASNANPPNPTGSTTPDIVSGTISFTDADLSDHHTVSVTAVSATGVTSGLTETNAVQLGWVTLGAVSDSTGGVTGSDTWTFSAPDDAFDYLAAGEHLTLTYTAQVSDGHGGVITTPFTVTVTGTNDTPTIAATSNVFSEASTTPPPNPTGSTTADIVSGTISFTDADLSDQSYGVRHGGLRLGRHQRSDRDQCGPARLGIAGRGPRLDRRRDRIGHLDVLGAGRRLRLSCRRRAPDSDLHRASQRRPWRRHHHAVHGDGDRHQRYADDCGNQQRVLRSLDAPPPNPTGSTTADIVSGTISFTDADLSDHHTVSITAVAASGVTTGLTETNAVQLGWVTLGAVSDATGGVTGSDTWTFSAPDDAFDYLAAGEQLTLTYMAQVSDGHGGVITTPFTVTVTGTNDTPVIGNPSVASVTDNTGVDGSGRLVASGTISIVDADHDQSSFQTTVTAANGDLGSLVLNANGSYTYTVANSAVEYLQAGETKVDTFTITSLDGTTKDVSFTINGINEAAVIGSAPVASVTKNSNVDGNGDLVASGTISVVDPDHDQSSFQTTVTAANGDLGSLALNANGSYTYTVSNAAVQSLGAGQTATDTFTVTSLDGTQQTESFTIHGANGAPVITPAAAQSITVSQASTISGISLSESGNTAGETFTVTLSDAHGLLSATASGHGDTVTATNSGTTLTITGSLTYVNADLGTLTDNNGTIGSDPITIIASDSLGGSAASQSTAVTVGPATPTYVVTSTADTTDAGTLRSAIVYANAHAGTVITFSNAIANSTITLTSELPLIEADGTVIDGGTNGITDQWQQPLSGVLHR